MTEAAPWLAESDAARPQAESFWLRADDGVRLRGALWRPDDAQAGVLLFTGRTEHVEKYAATAGALMAAGFAVISIDWRGQGLSDRLALPPQMGHVARFADYQRDVAALLGKAQTTLPRPWHLLAHSMGGAIGLRALHQGLPVASAAFSAPMWGINIPKDKRALAWVVSTAARLLHLDRRFAPGESTESYAATAPYEGNLLTSGREIYLALQAELRANPDIALGGVSLGWLGAALWETRALMRMPAPDVPALAFLGGDEDIVRPDMIRRYMARWPKGELIEHPGARHELLMERPEIRDAVLSRIITQFLTAAA